MNGETYKKEHYESLHTRQLMSELNDARAYRSQHADMMDDWLLACSETLQKGLKEYDERVLLIKSVLETREHVPNKVERAKTRKEKQLAKQNR